MDQKVNEIDSEVDNLTREFSRFISRFERLEQSINEIYRETGTREGRTLFEQIDDMQNRIMQLDQKLTEVQRDAIAARKLMEYGDVRLKEIMKALAIIYRNTDELEGNLLDAENIQTS